MKRHDILKKRYKKAKSMLGVALKTLDTQQEQIINPLLQKAKDDLE